MADYSVKQLAEKTGKSQQVVYVLARRLGRLPTLEEIKNRKHGRPNKFK